MIFELNDDNLFNAVKLCWTVHNYRVLIYVDHSDKSKTIERIGNIRPQPKPLYTTTSKVSFPNGSTITLLSASSTARYLRGNLILYTPELYTEELYELLRARIRLYGYWSEEQNG